MPHYAAILFRRTYADLALPGALMDRSQEWLGPTDAHWSHERKTWTFPSGATLSFGYLDNDADVYRYQSAEFQFIGFDELTQFSEAQYTYLFSRLRRPAEVGQDDPLARVPLRMRSASNPGNIGHGWVKRRFIAGRKPGVVFVPATLKDNPFIDQVAYEQSLGQLHSEVLKAQLLSGDWGAFEGAAFPDFSEATHVVDPFEIPDEWERFECMDFGSTNPTAWYVVAVDYDGNMVVFDEYYSPGLVSEHALAILERQKSGWCAQEWDGSLRPNPCYADPSVKNRLPTKTARGMTSVEAEFADFGIGLSAANNDRRAGYLRLAELLKLDPNRSAPSWADEDERGAPQLYVFAHCENLIEQLQVAPIEDRGPLTGEAVSQAWESSHGHATASLRYGVLSRPMRSEPSPKEPETEDEIKLDFLDRVQANAARRRETYY